MIIVITDACFLIDLIDIDLFGEFLGLGYQVQITSSVFAELEGDEYLKPDFEIWCLDNSRKKAEPR